MKKILIMLAVVGLIVGGSQVVPRQDALASGWVDITGQVGNTGIGDLGTDCPGAVRDMPANSGYTPTYTAAIYTPTGQVVINGTEDTDIVFVTEAEITALEATYSIGIDDLVFWGLGGDDSFCLDDAALDADWHPRTYLRGGEGNDYLSGGSRDDRISGNNEDIQDSSPFETNVLVSWGSEGVDRAYGTHGVDYLYDFDTGDAGGKVDVCANSPAVTHCEYQHG